MMLKNKKRIIIIIDLVVVGLIIIGLIILNNSNKNTFTSYDLKYDVPKELKYVPYDEANFVVESKEGWKAKVGLYTSESFNNKTIDELYKEELNKYEDSTELKVSKEVIEGIDFLVYNYLVYKRKSYIFISNKDIYYAIDVAFETDSFNSDSLIPVINSIQNVKE